MVVPKEKSFPRGGGDKPKADGPKKKSPDWCKNISKANVKGINGGGRNKPFKKPSYEEILKHLYSKDEKPNSGKIRPYTGKLEYFDIAEGMLILGIVYAVRRYELLISLPGNCCGQIPITNISEHYNQGLTKILAKNYSDLSGNKQTHYLRDMYQPGQRVVTRVVKTESRDNRQHKIILSMAPEIVHSGCSSEDILEGSVFTAAVVSVEEKGYIMDLGIKSARAFLSKEDSKEFEKFWNRGKDLGIGQSMRCLVKTVTTANQVTTVVLTADQELVAKASNNSNGTRLQAMLPGMQFNVTMTQPVFPSGMQVRLSDNVVGYVPPNHLPKAFKKPEDFNMSRVKPATVIYIKKGGTIFFSMKTNLFPVRLPFSPFKALKAGFKVADAVVWDVSAAGLTVRLGKDGGLKGFIALQHLDWKPTESEQTLAEQLLAKFPIGAKIACRVMDYCYMDMVYMCTMNKEMMKEKYVHVSNLKVGLVVSVTVLKITSDGLAVSLGAKGLVTGFVPMLHVSDTPLSHPEKMFKVGETRPAKVLSIGCNVFLTMKRAIIESNVMLKHFESAVIGKKYPGTIVLINTVGVLVEFYAGIKVFVYRYHLSHQLSREQDISTVYFVGQVVNCTVIRKTYDTQKLFVSLVAESFEENVKKEQSASPTNDQINPEDESDSAETGVGKEGGRKRKKKPGKGPTDVVTPRSEVTPTKRRKLSRQIAETDEIAVEAKLTPATGSKKKNKKKSLNTTGPMESEMTPANSSKKSRKSKSDTLEVSAVESSSTKKKNKKKRKSDTGTPGSPNDNIISSSKIKTSESSKKETTGPMESEMTPANSSKKSRRSKSDTLEVSAVESSSTKKKNKKKRKSDAGTPGSPDDNIISSFMIKTSESSKKAKKLNASLTNGAGNKKIKTEVATPLSSKPEAIKAESSDEDEPSEGALELPSLSVSTGFVWDATPNLYPMGASCEEDSSDDELVEMKKGKRSRQAIVTEKRLQAQIEEARLRSIEQRLMDPDQLPQTADEFDRLVLSSPDNSMVWLQYMAHHIQATEIEKARSIAQRALKTISFREEQEKLNVWVAWLNLENLYGTTESMKNTFEEAIKLNDPYQVYTQTLQIYADSHKLQDGDELIAIMTRKFKTNKEMWINVATYYMKSGQVAKSRALLQRALASLELKEHMSVITQFALLENKLGTKERAQTLMEQILTSYPKRVDVWSVYVDMLIKSDLVDIARQVLERAVAQRLPSHKMKTLFKKFLSFEETHGTEEGANRVRQLALDYVEAAAGTNMD